MITAALLISSFIYATAGEECIPSFGRGVGTIPPYCPDDHPDLDAGLCYKNCKTGYYAVGPLCWEECKGIDRGALCEIQSLATRAKHSYGRGVGVIPSDCGNKQKDAGLCYDYCPSGYYPVGPVCWEHCASGYRDDGASCYKNLFDFYFKKTKGRGAGTIPTSCASGFENDAGLCYKKCNAGYDGVGPVCWEVCKSGETDDGAFCRIPLITVAKHSYGRGVGVIPSKCENGQENDAGLCYPYCGDDIFDGVGPVCWNKNFGTLLAVVASTAPLAIPLSTVCSFDMINDAINNALSFTDLFATNFDDLDRCLLDNLVAEIDDSWDVSQTLVGIEIGISASIGGGIFGYIANKDNFPHFDSAPDFAKFVRDAKKDDFSDSQIADFLYDFLVFWYNNFFVNRDGINIYFGVAFKAGVHGMDVYWYYGTCNSVVLDLVSAGVQFTTIVHKSVADIKGESKYFQLGASTPFVEAGLGVSYWVNPKCEITGVGSYASFGAGIIPFIQIEGGQCKTPDVVKITKTLSPTPPPSPPKMPVPILEWTSNGIEGTTWYNTGRASAHNLDLNVDGVSVEYKKDSLVRSLKAVCFTAAAPCLQVNYDISPSKLKSLTIELYAYQLSTANTRGWTMSQDNGGYDRSILMHDSRFASAPALGVGRGTEYAGQTKALPMENKWDHIVAVWDGSNTPGSATLYMNNLDPFSTPPTTNDDGLPYFCINTNPSFANHNWNGCFAKISVWDSALTSSHVKQLTSDFISTASQ